MAARRGRGAAAEPAPPPAPEPVPEPEPEKVEEPAPAPQETELPATKSSISKDGRVTEKIIERIIICPGMQNPCGMMYPPPGPMAYQGPQNPGMEPRHTPPVSPCPCPCPCFKRNKKKSKKNKKVDECGEPCKHPFCIVQRARLRPQGLPWASGLYPGPPPQPPPPKQPPVIICQRPVLCCCTKCRPEECESEEEEEEDPIQNDTECFMTFMNLVFAASNVINERPEIL